MSMSTLSPASSSTKLGGYEFYKQVLGSPKYIVAPMVDQSELAWRRLSRKYGAQLIYTPMINAKMWTDLSHSTYRTTSFDISSNEEGNPTNGFDRPLIVQFCANDPEKLLSAALDVQNHCDAVDINLGCPQDIAKKGRYGAFLMDDWDLIYRLINTLHKNLSVPVTAKFRVYPTVEKTVEYAKMLESAGAQILTCHGRLREQRGQNAGLADWSKIRAVKSAVSVPVFANGCDGVMSAEGQLYNVALFNGLASSPTTTPSTRTPITPQTHPPHASLALEYLSIVHSLRTRTAISAIKGHLFKILRPALGREIDLRERLGKVRVDSRVWERWCLGRERRTGSGSGSDDVFLDSPLREYVEICREMKGRMDRARQEVLAGRNEEEVDERTGVDVEVLPFWLAQPYVRGVGKGM